MNARLGEPGGYSSQEALGAAYGLGLWIRALDRALFGLEVSHSGLGQATAQNGQNLLLADYSSTTAWLGGRFVPWENQDVAFFVSLRVGLALEHVDATGTRQLRSALEPATPFECKETRGPAFALGGGVGANVRLGQHIELVPRFDAYGEQLTSDELGGCAAGIGSVMNLMLGLGVAYGFDAPGAGNAYSWSAKQTVAALR
jgi:hypothetical protein